MWFEEARGMREEGLTYREISEKLDVNINTVKSRFLRHRRNQDKEEGVKVTRLTAQEERKPKIQERGEVYIISSADQEVTITKDKLRELKLLYCQDKLTINEVCRKLDIPRKSFMLIKNAFGITKSDVPFIDEDLYIYKIDDLVEMTLERRKESYFNKLQSKEIQQLKREVEKYREKDYFINSLISGVAQDVKKVVEEPIKKKLKRKGKIKNMEMLEIPIFDLHLEKLARVEETGNEYNHKIAKKRFFYITDEIIQKVKKRGGVDKIIFVLGGDFFNADTKAGTTTRGTQQNNTMEAKEALGLGVGILAKAIKELDSAKISNEIEVLGVSGNHDEIMLYAAILYISAFFKDSETVQVNTDQKLRKYIRYGNNLIGFTHGDKEKKRIDGLMQIEAAKAWGKTRFHEWHMGHFHSEQAREENGIIFRNLSSVTGTDAWHYENGYLGAVKKHQSFIWDHEKGLTEILITNIEE